MIGDGATDMEACPPADGFIGITFSLTYGYTKVFYI